jgi:hypothetical protein
MQPAIARPNPAIKDEAILGNRTLNNTVPSLELGLNKDNIISEKLKLNVPIFAENTIKSKDIKKSNTTMKSFFL